MKSIRNLILVAIAMLATVASAQSVEPGIATLRNGGFAQLQGKRVGLITNPTGVDNQLRSTIDILHEAEGVTLAALFAPEHGVRGDVHAGDHVANSIDPKTGVRVYSLFGKLHKPTPEMLADIDVLIYDIQDNGCRSYTFISTMGVCMDAAAEQGKEFMVLDRPNPVGGDIVEGCLVEKGFESFVSKFPIPYLYGLTPGELATLLNEERMLKSGKKCKLTVVPMTGWQRDMSFEATGMPWVLPSPHIPTPSSSLYYPMTGILGEFGYVSIGVGYTLPFQLIAATWIDAEQLADALTDLHLPGVGFRPIHIKPFYSVGKGENLQGVQIYVTDRRKAQLTLTQFYAMQEMARLWPDHKVFENADQKRFNMFDKVCGTDYIRKTFTRNYRVADIIDYWNKDVEAWRQLSSKYYLY